MRNVQWGSIRVATLWPCLKGLPAYTATSANVRWVLRIPTVERVFPSLNVFYIDAATQHCRHLDHGKYVATHIGRDSASQGGSKYFKDSSISIVTTVET